MFPGQWTWFSRFHPEKLISATERYAKEIKRVMGVLDTALEGKEYLVGDKCTYADLSFVTWSLIGQSAMDIEGFEIKKELPNYTAWMERLLARPAVKKTLEIRQGLKHTRIVYKYIQHILNILYYFL